MNSTGTCRWTSCWKRIPSPITTGDFLARQEGRSNFNESLVVGTARMPSLSGGHGHQRVLLLRQAPCGVVFGEKFRRAVDYAIQENLPLISVCCSGGARLYEGISALMPDGQDRGIRSTD